MRPRRRQLLHGKAAAENAAETARKTFEEGGIGAALPSIDVPRAELRGGLGVPALFVRAGLAASNGEVRRAVANNSISINDVRVTDPQRKVDAKDINTDGVVKLSLGRKKHALVVPG